MANYIAVARSNYFRVKDEAAFREWAASRELGVWEGDAGRVAIYANRPNEDGWPDELYDEATGTEFYVNIEEELAGHLQDGSVAILMTLATIGYSDMWGYAVAINNKGEEVRIDIHEIEDRAKHLGNEITSVD